MRRVTLAALAATLVLAGCAEPPQVANFAWQGAIPEGGWVRIRNGSGRIVVRRAPDATLTVGATVRTGGMHPRWVHSGTGSDMTFCVLFDRRGASCERAGSTVRFSLTRWMSKLMGHGGGQADVQYVLYVPAHVSVDVRSVNGAIDLQSVVRDVRARTVNGSIQATAVAESFDAETVNGSVNAVLGLTGDEGAVSLKSVNGSLTVELPPDLGAEVALATVNGKLSSEFDIGSASGRGKKLLTGTVGDGGRQVTMKAVNGSVTLKRRG